MTKEEFEIRFHNLHNKIKMAMQKADKTKEFLLKFGEKTDALKAKLKAQKTNKIKV